MQRVLAIESATDWLSVAWLEGERVVAERESEVRMQHAAALLPTVDAIMTEVGVGLDDLDAISVSTGPGSFTSLRIGLATVKGLAFSRGIPAVGVSTLEAMALAVLESQLGPGEVAGEEGQGRGAGESYEVLALLDARRGEWYAGGWRPGDPGGLPAPGLPEGLYSTDRLAASLASPVHVVAPEAGPWQDALEMAGVRVIERTLGSAGRPSAGWVGRLGQRRLAAGEGQPAHALGARYLRRAEAEAKRLGAPVEAGEVARVDVPPEGERNPG